MSNNRFEKFISQLWETNTTLDTLTDFKKVSDNTSKISMHLCALNYLLGKSDLESVVRDLFEENPKVFSVLPILVAVRDDKKVLNGDGEVVNINNFSQSVEGVMEFIETTGLAEIFRSSQITNLVDYVFGVEVGLDTNARKNRGGNIMERYVANVFDEAGVEYLSQCGSGCYPQLACLGKDKKVFDFVVEVGEKRYFIETNFYNGGGSKLNEVARAYSELAPKINGCENFEFVWITDGQGWLSAKSKLAEAFEVIPSIYNLTTLGDFVDKLKK